MPDKRRQPLFAICLSLIFLLCGQVAHADARTAYLIDMLEKGGNYRIRVQAAATLGKLRSKEAIPSLAHALADENELVCISAAIALGQIGDPSVVPAMESAAKKTRSQAAKSQLAATIRVLRALSAKEEGGGALRPSGKPSYLVRIDPMGNSSGVQQEGILEKLRQAVESRLANEPGVVLQAFGLDGDAVRRKLKEEQLSGYIISGSLMRMEQVGNRVIVKIGLNVFSNPDYNLLMMPTVEAAVPVGSGALSQEDRAEVEDRAIKVVINKLVSDIFQNMGQDNR